MMKKILFASAFTMLSLCSTTTMAHSGHAHNAVLSQHMRTLASSFVSFNKAKTPAEALTALNKMKQASNQSKSNLPNDLQKLPRTDPKVQGYYALYNQMNAHIDRAIVLTKAGKLNEAKQIAKQINAIKMKGHQHYH